MHKSRYRCRIWTLPHFIRQFLGYLCPLSHPLVHYQLRVVKGAARIRGDHYGSAPLCAGRPSRNNLSWRRRTAGQCPVCCPLLLLWFVCRLISWAVSLFMYKSLTRIWPFWFRDDIAKISVQYLLHTWIPGLMYADIIILVFLKSQRPLVICCCWSSIQGSISFPFQGSGLCRVIIVDERSGRSFVAAHLPWMTWNDSGYIWLSSV